MIDVNPLPDPDKVPDSLLIVLWLVALACIVVVARWALMLGEL